MLNGLPCMDYPKWTTPKLVANIVSRTKRFSAFFPRANWSEINRRSRSRVATILSLADLIVLLSFQICTQQPIRLFALQNRLLRRPAVEMLILKLLIKCLILIQDFINTSCRVHEEQFSVHFKNK